jgi:hypothetical protein
MTTPELILTYRIGNGPRKEVRNADAYSVLLTIARLYIADGRELKRKPGEQIVASTAAGVQSTYAVNMFVTANALDGLKVHVKPGDCGCAFKRFARITGGRR